MSKQIAFNVKFDFAASGAGFAQSALTESFRLAELGEAIGTSPTLAQWNDAAKLFIAGATATGYKAPEKLWQRTVARAQEAGQLVDKPKSGSDDAVKKSAQREAEKAKLAEAAKLSTAELLVQAEKLAASGDYKAAAKTKDLAAQVVKAQEKAAAEKVADVIKPLVETINLTRDSLRKANAVASLELLALVCKALGEGKQREVAEALAPFKPADVVSLARVETIAPAPKQRKGKAKTGAVAA